MSQNYYYCAAGIFRVFRGVHGEVWAQGEWVWSSCGKRNKRFPSACPHGPKDIQALSCSPLLPNSKQRKISARRSAWGSKNNTRFMRRFELSFFSKIYAWLWSEIGFLLECNFRNKCHWYFSNYYFWLTKILPDYLRTQLPLSLHKSSHSTSPWNRDEKARKSMDYFGLNNSNVVAPKKVARWRSVPYGTHLKPGWFKTELV